MREKVLNIILLVVYAIFPIFLFVPFFYYKTDSGTTKYNIINIKDLNMAYFVIGIILLISIVSVIAASIIMLIKKNYYYLPIKITTGLSIILFAFYAMIYSLVLSIIMFFIITLNMFIIAFDLKLNKRKKPNMAIFAITYLLFIFALVLSTGLIPKA